MKLLFLTYLALQILHGRDSQVTGNHWSYAHSSKWDGTCHTEDGRQHRQSPIDIESIVPYSTPPFVFRNYGFINTTQTNNGHTLKVLALPKSLLLHQDPQNLLGEEEEDEEEGPEAAEDARPQVLGGGLPGPYILHSFHFHWGSDSFKGSEHLLKGCAFAAEMHLVHFKKKYGSIQEALKHSDGLAVLGIWLTPAHATWRHSHLDTHATTSKADYYFAAGSVPVPGACSYTREEHEVSSHHWFDMITPHDNAHGEGEGRPTPVYLRQLLPFDTGAFYRYQGSLTTPPCTENVIWTVFHEAVSVPEGFLEGLRSLVMPSHPEHQVSDNFRPPQSLSGRLVFSRGGTMEVPASCERSRELHATCTDFPDIYVTSESENEIEAEETMMELSCPDEEPSSPINLYLMQSDPHYSPALQWRPIGHCKGARVVNDGDVLKVLYPTRSPEWELVGSNLTNAYYLSAIQLRWRSEHRLGGLTFPLEMQLMHYNSKYKTFQEAMTRTDGLVMVSKFFQEPESEEITLDSMDGYQIRHNKHLAGIIEAVQKNAQTPLGHRGIRSPDIRHLMGDASTYYEYKGSVGSITPDVCPSGTATWMVIRKTGHISRSQMESLREMQSWDGSAITSNNRPLASSNGRKVILRIDSRELAHEFKTMMKRRKRKTVKPPLAPTSVPESEHEQSLPRLSLQPQASRSAKSSSSASSPPTSPAFLLLSSLSFLNLMTVIEKFRRCL
ncbi:uncharacterized protein LOC135212657 [Macrobrachium nipponense]|uniref:uncharacterized protein LOC135212657 n=1 Tax=Macrobrachium nipponense TaxID=159736 RepID=UPI0030C8D1B5